MTIFEEEHDDTDNPLRARVVRGVRFRADDPPEVREALVEAALQNEKAFGRESLEIRGVSDV